MRDGICTEKSGIRDTHFVRSFISKFHFDYFCTKGTTARHSFHSFLHFANSKVSNPRKSVIKSNLRINVRDGI